MLAKNLEQLEVTVPIEVVDIDVYPEMVQTYGIRGVPTLLAVDGEIEVSRSVGMKSVPELKQWLESLQ